MCRRSVLAVNCGAETSIIKLTLVAVEDSFLELTQSAALLSNEGGDVAVAAGNSVAVDELNL